MLFLLFFLANINTAITSCNPLAHIVVKEDSMPIQTVIAPKSAMATMAVLRFGM